MPAVVRHGRDRGAGPVPHRRVVHFAVIHPAVIYAARSGGRCGLVVARPRKLGLWLFIPRDQVLVELVVPVPGPRMPLERSDDRRERVAKAVLRFPPEQRPCAGDVEDIVVVAAVDHPGLDKVVAAERFVLQDDPGLRERLRDADRLPALAVERLPDDVLDLGIAGRVGFADEQRQF